MSEAPVTPELAALEARPAGRQRPFLGYALVVCAVTLWGASATVIKVLLDSGLSTFRLAELRCLGGAVLFLAAVLVTRPSSMRIARRELPRMAAFGVLGLAFVQFFYFVGIERLQIGVALVLQYTAPVFVALWARFVIREPVGRRLWYGLALALAGLATVVEVWSGFALDGGGVAACLVAALAYAVYILLAERGLKDGRDVLSLLAWGFLFATLFWTIVQPWWSFPAGELAESAPLLGRLDGHSAPTWLLAGFVVVFGTFVPFILMVTALHHVPATRATIVAMVEPVVAALVAWAWLGESLGPAQLVGGLLVLGGVALAETARAG